MSHRRVASLSMIAVGAITSVLLSSVPASAEIVQLTCLGTGANHYEPGLTNTPRLTTATTTAVLGPCIGVPVGIVSATYETLGTGPLSCTLVPAATAPAVTTINWNDGTHSRALLVASVVDRPAGQIVITGTFTVVEGRFIGATIVQTGTLLQTDLLGCFTLEGVSDVAGPVTLTVTKLF